MTARLTLAIIFATFSLVGFASAIVAAQLADTKDAIDREWSK